jgi:hypothetical protein
VRISAAALRNPSAQGKQKEKEKEKRNPSAHFALCALLQRCCIHQEFVIYLSKFVKHVFLLYFVC